MRAGARAFGWHYSAFRGRFSGTRVAMAVWVSHYSLGCQIAISPAAPVSRQVAGNRPVPVLDAQRFCRLAAHFRSTVADLLAAVPVTMTALLAARSNRPEIAWTVAGLSSLHPAHLLTLAFPDLFRAMNPADLA